MVFILFAISIVFVEKRYEKQFRAANRESVLEGYTEMLNEYMKRHDLYGAGLDSIYRVIDILPPNVRVTIIDDDGKVMLDNVAKNVSGEDGHLERPEIRAARYATHGSNIRLSASTQKEYVYYAKYYNEYYIRVALPYGSETQQLPETGGLFIYSILALFVVVLALVNYIFGRFGSSVVRLKSDMLAQIEANKQSLGNEREKLIRHFRFSGEGICIYTPDMKKIYANTLFIQYLNFITDKTTFVAEELFAEELFNPVLGFIKDSSRKENHFTHRIGKNGKTFSSQTVVFKDKTFEITIKDITEAEKTHLLKQEMTSNIAHELRTPVTSIRGYLETLKESKPDPERQKQFIDKAYMQSIRLSNLIDDVSIISKIEEAPSRFAIEEVNLSHLLEELRIDLTDKLAANRIKFCTLVKEDLTVKGNYTLLYSIFRNLADNTISYAGQDIEIHIENYTEDEGYLYFCYYDTGKGVDEKHLGRLFERFYRLSEGRTRNTGGSGLGLSIVKNAILFHQGNIQVKNHYTGGLEFMFTLKK